MFERAREGPWSFQTPWAFFINFFLNRTFIYKFEFLTSGKKAEARMTNQYSKTSSFQNKNFSQLILLGLLAILLVMPGCMFPEHMEVRAGLDPRNQDDDVRFQTTYYFRAFNMCGNPETKGEGTGQPAGAIFMIKEKGPYTIVSDSLYRFKMTGKANSLWNKIRFESGILKKEEIDPLGAAVEYDKNTGRHRFISTEENNADSQRAKRIEEIKELMSLYKELEGLATSKEGTQKETDEAVKSTRKEVATSIASLIKTMHLIPTKEKTTGDGGDPKASVTKTCPDGTPSKQGFQIFGPEGYRTFNQDERLLLVMSSSGKPLIGAMKELAGRFLAEQPNRAEILLPMVKERLKLVKAEHHLETNALNAKSIGELFTNVKEELAEN